MNCPHHSIIKGPIAGASREIYLHFSTWLFRVGNYSETGEQNLGLWCGNGYLGRVFKEKAKASSTTGCADEERFFFLKERSSWGKISNESYPAIKSCRK